MKILVYGAGVLGSFYAARLQEGGNDVSILARGARLEELREHGVVLEAINVNQRVSVRVKVLEALEPDDAFDLILVVMRRNQIASVLPTLAANAASPTVAFIGNNVSGAGEMASALGRERVLMGFGAVGGVRDGHVVRYVASPRGDRGKTHLGELDGDYSPRLQHIAQAFERTGVPVVVERDIDAWLKTHAAMVLPLAFALYLADGDTYRLARTRDGIVLAIRAVRECLGALRAGGIAITPGWFRAFEWVPEPLLIAMVKRMLSSEDARVGLAGHARVARDEMTHLARELTDLIRPTKVPTAALDHLLTFGDSDEPPMVDGRAAIPVDWRGVWVSAGSLATLALLIRRLLPGGE